MMVMIIMMVMTIIMKFVTNNQHLKHLPYEYDGDKDMLELE